MDVLILRLQRFYKNFICINTQQMLYLRSNLEIASAFLISRHFAEFQHLGSKLYEERTWCL